MGTSYGLPTMIKEEVRNRKKTSIIWRFIATEVNLGRASPAICGVMFFSNQSKDLQFIRSCLRGAKKILFYIRNTLEGHSDSPCREKLIFHNFVCWSEAWPSDCYNIMLATLLQRPPYPLCSLLILQ